MIKTITDASKVQEAKRALDIVFRSKDPFSNPFTSAIEDLLVFFPTFGYGLTELQFKVLLESVRKLGYPSFYLSIVEIETEISWIPPHCICEEPSYEEYRGMKQLILENALYSAKGPWGVLVSHENHAMVGGSADFIGRIRKIYPWKEDRERLEEFWRGNPAADWLEQLPDVHGE